MSDLLWLKGSLGLRSGAEFIDCYRSRWVGLEGEESWRCDGAAALEVRTDPAGLHPPLRARTHCKIPIFAKLKGWKE